MKRVLCIWLPNWPIQRLVVARPELKGGTILLHARWGSRGERVVACSSAAQANGIDVGIPLPEATALLRKNRQQNRQPSFPDTTRHAASPAARPTLLHIEAYTPEQDRQELLRLAEWCEQFSPLVSIENADWVPAPRGMPRCVQRSESLLLDATGTGAWFGSESHLADKVIQDFAGRGYIALVAIADTIGVAWGVAHFGFGIWNLEFGKESTKGNTATNSPHPFNSKSQIPNSKSLIISPPQALSALQHLPVEALRLPGETIDLLHQLGVFQIQQLLRLPRHSLSSRLGSRVLQRLDQATGAVKEVLVAHRAPPKFHTQYSFEYPTTQLAAIEHVLQQLIEQLAQQLAQQDRGAVQLEVRLDCLTKDPISAPTGKVLHLGLDLFRPLAEPQHFLELVRMQLEQTSLPGPVRQVDIRATKTALREAQQNEFFADASRIRARDLAMLVDRLGSRLGHERVLRPRLQATAQPERAYHLVPLTNHATHLAASKTATPPKKLDIGPNDRPLHLCDPPQSLNVLAVAPDGPPVRFHIQNRLHQVTQFWGPERIETGWWRGRTIRRDYYRVETPTGQRFWLFRHGNDGQWFLHGTFD